MKLNVVGIEVPLLFSPSFLSELEDVVDRNVENNVQLTALFISRMLKGLQNLSNSEQEVLRSWDAFSFEIEDIGVVTLSPLYDPDTNISVYAVESIQWKFASSGLFKDLL